jgi:hypothetical protein
VNPQWAIKVLLDDAPRDKSASGLSAWAEIWPRRNPKPYDEQAAKTRARQLTIQARGVATYVAQEIP